MPRKKLIKTHEHVYHISTRSNSKEWFYLPSHEVWSICLGVLEEGCERFEIEIHAFVLMNNHYHLMLRTPKCDIDKFMQFFNKKMSDRINMSTGRINHVFGARYRWSIITDERYYLNVLKYLYQNPLRANICGRVEHYPYSTLEHHNFKFPIRPYLLNPDLSWLNQRYSPEDQNRIKQGFKRPYYRPNYSKSSRRNDYIL